jgi:integral membrane sensor domain MASE1
MCIARQFDAVGVNQPILVPFFDDLASWFHAVLGFTASFLPASASAAVAGAYLLYQLWEREPLPNKIGDFGEYLIGYLAGVTVSR